ncbi:MAG: hypothetical protein MMC33_000129 [Icmadophila ericetorum]|nr:hypothetical protein [Icmadophila ericetorum]
MLYRSWSWLPLAISALGFFHRSVLVNGDADFESVRTRLTKDHSGKAGDSKDKYFHESVFHPHYDGRFAEKQLKEDDRKQHLTALVQTYLTTMADLGAETWLMHGTLMGWWWNRKILPWDDDIDVQMTIDTLSFLANFYNMTVYHYRSPNFPEGKDYMLEINPTFNFIGGPYDKLNMIDARWIDRDTGLFIDITSVRPNMTARAMGKHGALMCKDKHNYIENQIFPLRDSIFEETPVKIPFDYTYLLEEEYSKASLTRTEWSLHEWNQTTMTWEPLKGASRYPKGGPRRGRPSRPVRPARSTNRQS